MNGKLDRWFLRMTVSVAIAIFCASMKLNAQQTGDFNVAYGYTPTSQARTAVPTPSAMAGTASFGVYLPASFLLAASTQTFTETKAPGSIRTWSYGVTNLEVNHGWTLWNSEPQSLDLQADYTLTLPTDGNEPPNVEHYAHQFLGVLAYQRSKQNYFELDAGDLLGARSAEPGYKQTALLSLIGQHNLRPDGSGTNIDVEVDASPASEGAPSSAILTAGADHAIKSNITLTALALIGLTANDPAIGVTLRIKFTGSFAKRTPSEQVLTLSKLQRLERPRFFGKIGRF